MLQVYCYPYVSLFPRFINPDHLTPEDLNEGVINVYMDATSKNTFYFYSALMSPSRHLRLQYVGQH